MYFIDQDHQNNYNKLMEKFKLTAGGDGQWESNIYLAAIPDIFTALMMKRTGSPLGYYVREDKKIDDTELSGSTTKIVELGLSLFNGREVDLNSVFRSVTREDWVEALLQAIKIRSRNKEVR